MPYSTILFTCSIHSVAFTSNWLHPIHVLDASSTSTCLFLIIKTLLFYRWLSYFFLSRPIPSTPILLQDYFKLTIKESSIMSGKNTSGSNPASGSDSSSFTPYEVKSTGTNSQVYPSNQRSLSLNLSTKTCVQGKQLGHSLPTRWRCLPLFQQRYVYDFPLVPKIPLLTLLPS